MGGHSLRHPLRWLLAERWEDAAWGGGCALESLPLAKEGPS